jgi:hypothetical protein
MMDINWKQYEDYVYEKFRTKYPEHSVEKNLRVIGKITNQSRQIDIAIRGNFVGHPLFVAVDCKYYSEKVDVKDIESFIGMLSDIRADFGILVTNRGYTQAALKQADASHIKLDIVEVDEIENYEIDIEICHECDPGEDHLPGFIEWYGQLDVLGDVEKVASIGRCNICNTLYIRCLDCNQVTSIVEAFYDEPVECTGGCGTQFIVSYEHLEKGSYLEHLTVSKE